MQKNLFLLLSFLLLLNMACFLKTSDPEPTPPTNNFLPGYLELDPIGLGITIKVQDFSPNNILDFSYEDMSTYQKGATILVSNFQKETYLLYYIPTYLVTPVETSTNCYFIGTDSSKNILFKANIKELLGNNYMQFNSSLYNGNVKSIRIFLVYPSIGSYIELPPINLIRVH